MKLNHLRDVLAVTERGSVRAAARGLGVAQSALTRSIRELEKELGALLFERGAKGTKLTGLGERFVRRAHTIRAEMRRAREEMHQLQGGTQGSINIALSNVPHFVILPTVLPLFRARYPDLQLKIRDTTFRNVEMELRDGVLDFYVGPLPELLVMDGLQSEKLFDNTRFILARRGHPLAGARSLRDLVNAKWVTTSITDKAENELAPMFEKYGLPPPLVAVQAQSTLTVFVSVAYSDLLIMLPRQWTEFPFTRDALQKINVIEKLPAPSISILRRTDIPMTPAAEYFCDLARRASANIYPAETQDPLLGRAAALKKKAASRTLAQEGATRRGASAKR
ncbi:MAG TPA: LysR substrate-binding domain-containing protein [Steroidobacteraceae bacterium]